MKVIDDFSYNCEDLDINDIPLESLNDLVYFDMALEDEDKESIIKRAWKWIVEFLRKVVNFFRKTYNNISGKLSKIKNRLLKTKSNINKVDASKKIEVSEEFTKKLGVCYRKSIAVIKIIDLTIKIAKGMANFSNTNLNAYMNAMLVNYDFANLSKERSNIIKVAKMGIDEYKEPENLDDINVISSTLSKITNSLEQANTNIHICTDEFEKARVRLETRINKITNGDNLSDPAKRGLIEFNKNVQKSVEYCSKMILDVTKRLDDLTKAFNDLVNNPSLGVESHLNEANSDEDVGSKLVQAIYSEFGLEGVTNIITNLIHR